jgi:hypothetical protein
MSDGPTRYKVLWKLPRLSQEFRDGPIIRIERDVITMSYDYETPTGAYEWKDVSFSGVAAASFTADESCVEEQVAAYDKLIEVEESGWLTSLQTARQAAQLEPAQGLKHMRIYFDEIGCLDVVATRFDARE